MQLEIWRYVRQMRGDPLEEKIRSRLESHFKRSLGHARIHIGPLPAASARMLNARAYALGNHIVLGEGEYRPEARDGLWLLAHEVAHVVQQEAVYGFHAMELEPPDSKLEAEADAAATAFVLGQPAPPISSEQSLRAIIRCKGVLKCPGEPVFETISALPKEVHLPANQAIEADYLRAHQDHAAAIFFNSQFTPSQDVRLPRGAPNKRFGDLLLEKLRGISYQLRPDIIDFRDHSFYEIKTEAHAVANRAKVCYQLSHYYDLTEQIRQQHGSNVEPPWNQDLASWKPLPILPFMGQLEDMFVCTAATDYQAWPCGLVLYDVRKRKEEEKQSKRAVKSIRIVAFDRDFSSVMPDRKRMRSVIGDFNPYLPEFVIIAPVRMYQTWKSRARDERTSRMFEVKLPPFLDTKTPVGQFHRIGWMMVGFSAAAYAVAFTGMILVDVAAFEGAGAAVGTGAAGGTSAAGGGEVISLTAYKAMLASKEAATAAAAAGVLIVAGFPGKARANQVAIKDIAALRVVPVERFKPYKGRQAASSADDVPSDFLQTEESIKDQFEVGSTVLYDWEHYLIIGRLRVEY